MTTTAHSEAMDMPPRLDLPLFVYGALKPGLPAFEILHQRVASTVPDSLAGELLVRDGLPLLQTGGSGKVEGCLLSWNEGQEQDAYVLVCAFEPRKHYQWSEVNLGSGKRANTLVIRYPTKGNPQHFESSSWTISDDPAFGPGLGAVERVLGEVDQMPGDSFDANWQRFFRSQMAYLLLWSILERLSALCFGPNLDPMERIKRLHELPGMAEAVGKYVQRSDRVSDSRNPDLTYRLEAANARSTILYYYQVRSNLSHRGKGVFNEFEKVHSSLRELLAITRQYLKRLAQLAVEETRKVGEL